jgi:hypothetical protein
MDGTNQANAMISVRVSSRAATGTYTLEVKGSGTGVNRNAFLGVTVQ